MNKFLIFLLFICHSREKARGVITADSTRKKVSQSPWNSYSKGSDGLRWQSFATGNKGKERLPLLAWTVKLTSNPTPAEGFWLDIQGFPISKGLVPNISQTVYSFQLNISKPVSRGGTNMGYCCWCQLPTKRRNLSFISLNRKKKRRQKREKET